MVYKHNRAGIPQILLRFDGLTNATRNGSRFRPTEAGGQPEPIRSLLGTYCSGRGKKSLLSHAGSELRFRKERQMMGEYVKWDGHKKQKKTT